MIQFDSKLMEGVLQSLHLHGEAILGVVPAQLHVGSEGSVFQTSLGQLQGILLGPQCVLQMASRPLLLLQLGISLQQHTKRAFST